jgi:hypothetical protein
MKTIPRRLLCCAIVLLGFGPVGNGDGAVPADLQAGGLVLHEGVSDRETPPTPVRFRFEITLYVQPLADGPVEILASPFAATDDSARSHFQISGDIIRVKDGQTIASILTADPETKTEVELKAGTLYRIQLASLVDGVPGDKTASILLPEGLAAAILASFEKPAWVEGINGFLWVPAGSREIPCVGAPRVSLISPDGVRTDISTPNAGAEDAKALPVRPDETGQIWKVGNQTRGLVGFGGNIPPWINLNGRNLLLPAGAR